MGRRQRNRRKFPRRYCTIDFYKCIGYNSKAQGIVKFHGKNFNVDELLKGEEARLIVYYEDEKGGEARACQIKEESKDRKLPLGHPKMSLGSYQTAHMTDKAQDQWKQDMVERLFNRKALPIKVGQRTNYRNKVVLHDGGFFPPGRGRRFSIKPTPDQWDLMEIDFDKYQDTKGDIIIRRLDTEISGKPGEQLFAEHTMLGKKFSVNLNSFYQVNNEMAELAYKEIIDEVPENSIVYDLFGGAATIGIHVADKAKKVYSVEINKDSHNDAKKNIALNNIDNVEAIMGDANEWVRNNDKNADVVIFDPARSGISEDSANAINKSGVEKIIYLSCNIETQIRDVKRLTNYEIVKIQPYDFFPQTYHVENLVVLTKRV